MPCTHKFQEYLNLHLLDFVPTTLIIGTFNPSWGNGNQAEWFYGRTGNNYFWDVLPRLYNPELNLRNSTAVEWKEFCKNNCIALTDLIDTIVDADQDNEEHRNLIAGYKDSEIAANFHQFILTDVVELLQRNPTIRHVYLTRQLGIALFDTQWTQIVDYCQTNNITHASLLTPSASARFQMGDYAALHPNIQNPLRNFIFDKWSESWHF